MFLPHDRKWPVPIWRQAQDQDKRILSNLHRIFTKFTSFNRPTPKVNTIKGFFINEYVRNQ